MNKKILFFTTPAYGHIIPVAPIMKELIKRGCELTCYSSSRFRKEIISLGAKYIEYPFDADSFVEQSSKITHFDLALMVIEAGHNYFYDILEKITPEKYNLILYDSLCFIAKHIAFKLGIKSICFGTTFAINNFVMLSSGMIWTNIKMMLKNLKTIKKIKNIENEFRGRNALKKFSLSDFVLNKGTKTIILVPKEIQPFASTFPMDVEFVGTTIKDRVQNNFFDEYDHNDEVYDYYISLGTVFHGNQKLIENIVYELALENRKILVSTGSDNVVFDKPNVISKPRVNQVKVLPKVKYFINHGGLNSVLESIYFGIPQFCFPQQMEQKANSRLIKRLKLGSYSIDYQKDKLKKINYSQIRLNYYSKILRETDGKNNAVNIIMNI